MRITGTLLTILNSTDLFQKLRGMIRMKNWLHEKSTIVFSVTLVVYVLIWLTVSYVGVYVTYVAGPILLLSGVIMWLSNPEEKESDAKA